MLLILLACGEFGLDSGGPDDQRCDGEAVCVTSIDPEWGPLAGGTSVTVQGVGFEGDVQLFFESAPLDVTVLSDEEITLTTPAVPGEGEVDVTVASDLGEYTVPGGFTYSTSEPDADTDTDTDSDTDVQPTGKVEGLIEFSYLAYGCPACFGLTSQLQFSVAAVFHDPVSGGWYDHIPPKGNCTTTVSGSAPASTYNDLGTWAYLDGGNSISLQRQGSNLYLSSGLDQNDLVKTSTYGLSIPDAGLEVPGALVTPAGFDTITPEAIGLDDPQAFSAVINRNNAAFGWSPSGVSTGLIIQVDVYDPNSGYLGSVLCHAEDTGSATVPSGGFTGYPSGALLAINVVRMEMVNAVNPDTGHIVQSGAQLGLVGTGVLQ